MLVILHPPLTVFCTHKRFRARSLQCLKRRRAAPKCREGRVAYAESRTLCLLSSVRRGVVYADYVSMGRGAMTTMLEQIVVKTNAHPYQTQFIAFWFSIGPVLLLVAFMIVAGIWWLRRNRRHRGNP